MMPTLSPGWLGRIRLPRAPTAFAAMIISPILAMFSQLETIWTAPGTLFHRVDTFGPWILFIGAFYIVVRVEWPIIHLRLFGPPWRIEVITSPGLPGGVIPSTAKLHVWFQGAGTADATQAKLTNFETVLCHDNTFSLWPHKNDIVPISNVMLCWSDRDASDDYRINIPNDGQYRTLEVLHSVLTPTDSPDQHALAISSYNPKHRAHLHSRLLSKITIVLSCQSKTVNTQTFELLIYQDSHGIHADLWDETLARTIHQTLQHLPKPSFTSSPPT